MTKTAYLTIDDAPSYALRHKVDYLNSHQIPAVFFCQGQLLEERPDDAIYAIQQGHIIGNHSYDHPYFSALTLEDCFDQIRRTDTIIDGIYAQAGIERPAHFFRFPYGDKGGLTRKNAIQDYLRDLGYSQPAFEDVTYSYYRRAGLLDDVDWYWTYDVLEWSVFSEEHEFGIDSLEKVLARMDEDEPEGCRGLNYPGSADIILTHDLPEGAAMFEPIMDRLLAKGIHFLPIPSG